MKPLTRQQQGNPTDDGKALHLFFVPIWISYDHSVVVVAHSLRRHYIILYNARCCCCRSFAAQQTVMTTGK